MQSSPTQKRPDSIRATPALWSFRSCDLSPVAWIAARHSGGWWDPGTKIPDEATRIHKIHDAAVAEAPEFRVVWPAVSSLINGHVLIGHTLNFDLTLLRYECAHIGKDIAVEHTLDVRLLAETEDLALHILVLGSCFDDKIASAGINIVCHGSVSLKR